MDIFKELQKNVDGWEQSTIQIADGLQFNHYQTIRRIEFYNNSRYLQGQNNRDSRGKQKPFYNISNYRVNIATRATDIDTKDIQITADEPQFAPVSFILQKEVYNWMKDTNFAKVLNDMGFTRAKYGGVLIKKCDYEDEEEGEVMEIEVVDWRNVITDPVNVTETVIEKHFMNAQELAEKEGVWSDIKEVIDIARKSTDGKVEIYEIHGNFPESYAPEGGDEYTYLHQCFYVLKNGKNKKILYHYFEEENPYKYIAWEKVPGRGLGRGIMEDGFEAQMWTNDAIIREKEAMELGSKLIFKSTDPNVQNNVLTEMDNGSVIKISNGTDFTQANTITNALPEFQNLVDKWNSQLERTTSTFDAISGETMPSNTPYRTTAILNQEATSMFDYRREEMGIFLTEVFTDWVMPYLMKKFNKGHILRAEFTAEELEAIDTSYANSKVNEEVMKIIDSGKPVYAEDYAMLVSAERELLRKGKQHRFLDIPKGFYKGLNAKVTVVTTGEQRNKAVILETLNNLLLTIAKAPQVLQDPKLSQIFGRILEVSGSGISPVSLGLGQGQDPMAQLPAGAVPPDAPQPVVETASQIAQTA